METVTSSSGENLQQETSALPGCFVMKTVAPNIYVRNMEQTIAFYQLLGFEIITTVPDGRGQSIFVLMQSGEVSFMFQTFQSIENTLRA